MDCSNCGASASGKFCSNCGSRIANGEVDFRSAQEWENEHRYHVLLHFDEVRERIARHAADARKVMSAEDFLKLCDLAITPLLGVPMSLVAGIVVPIYARLGVKTGKRRSKILQEPIGNIIIATICSFARCGQNLKQVHQGMDGCVLEAVMPSDLWSWKGQLVVSIQHHRAGTQVEAVTKIPGQLYDWGKSKQCLDQLFEDLE